MDNSLNCYFFVHRYAEEGKGFVSLALTMADQEPQVFNAMRAGVADIGALYRFSFALSDALDNGYLLFSYNSLRYGLRYITTHLPVKIDGLKLVFNHYDIAFAVANMVGEDAVVPPILDNSFMGTMTMLAWIKDIIEGNKSIQVKTPWAESVMSRFKMDAEYIVQFGPPLLSVGDYFLIILKENNSYHPDKFKTLYDHITWLFSFKKELTEYLEKTQSGIRIE